MVFCDTLLKSGCFGRHYHCFSYCFGMETWEGCCLRRRRMSSAVPMFRLGDMGEMSYYSASIKMYVRLKLYTPSPCSTVELQPESRLYQHYLRVTNLPVYQVPFGGLD